MVSLRKLPVGALESMATAGEQVLECYRVLQKSGSNVVAARGSVAPGTRDNLVRAGIQRNLLSWTAGASISTLATRAATTARVGGMLLLGSGRWRHDKEEGGE